MAALVRAYDNEGDLCEFSGLEMDCIRWTETGIVYFCTFGRNAWHSTWVHKYYPASMYDSGPEATHYAEQQRKQGSVFYIRELPALHIYGGIHSFVVTQINSRCPLVDYRTKSFELADDARRVFVRGNSLLEAVESFEVDSSFWRKRQPLRNSVIVLHASCSDSLPGYPRKGFKAWRSISVSAGTPMSWEPIKNVVSPKGINEIAGIMNI